MDFSQSLPRDFRLNLELKNMILRKGRMIVKKFFGFICTILILFLIFYPLPLLTPTLASSDQKLITHLVGGTVLLDLPLSMEVRENPLQERELLQYSAFFRDEGISLQGYMQIWQIKDLNNFLVQTKEQSTFDFYTYSLNPIKIGKFQGILNLWGASMGEQSTISAKEYWLQLPKEGQFLRLAFLTNKPVFPEEHNKIIAKVLSSIRLKDNTLSSADLQS